MTTSAKTELISTTLKNIYLRRQRALARKSADAAGSGSNVNVSTNSASSSTQDFEDLGDFVAFWLTAFQNLFLIPRGKVDSDDSCTLFENGDDICYIVEKVADENGCLMPVVGVKRFTDITTVDNVHEVFTSPSIDWEETTYLNLLIHLCKFKLSSGILQKGSSSSSSGRKSHHHRNSKLHLKKHFVVTTYASPFKHRMDKKSSRNVLSFPNVYFLIDDFESAWDKVTLSQGQEFCVELVAEIDPRFLNMYSNRNSSSCGAKSDKFNGVDVNSHGTTDGASNGDTDFNYSHNQTTIFLGASSFSQIQEVFKKRQASTNFISSFSTLFNKKQEVPTEFINMTGPNKVGKAQVAVSPVPGESVSTSGQSTDTAWEHLFSFADGVTNSATSHNYPHHPNSGANNTRTNIATSSGELRLQCGLHCGITYVSVPCEHIMRMIFDTPREPSLLAAATHTTPPSSSNNQLSGNSSAALSGQMETYQ
ncbi:uncharacterized protein LOC142349574 isoform X2 [Convolutriloba macropyga]